MSKKKQRTENPCVPSSVAGGTTLKKSKKQKNIRAINPWGGCNAKNILWLNDVFDIQHDKETIDWLRQEADGYDRDLKTVSDSLMQEKLKVKQIQQ